MTEVWTPDNLSSGSVILSDGNITSLDFHREGKYCVMSSSENSLHLIDSLSGLEKKKLYARTHGIASVKYTHHESCVLLTSSIARDRKHCDIRYLSMYDNRYLRFFKGHTDKVHSVDMSPTEDYFLSSSADKTVRLWNVNTDKAVAELKLPSKIADPVVKYDRSGIIFGVQCRDYRKGLHSIKLFDARMYENGPFQDIAPQPNLLESAVMKGLQHSGSATPSRQEIASQLSKTWSNFEFSPDGLKILVNTGGDSLFVLDGFKEETEPLAICGRSNSTGGPLGACFSADSKYIIAGNDENEVQIFDNDTGDCKNTLTGHVAPVGCVACNPKYDVLATGCLNAVLWIHSSGSASQDD